MNSLWHAELLAGHSPFDLRSLPNSHCSWRMTSWDGRGGGGWGGRGGEGGRTGCRPNYEWTKAEKRPNETKKKCGGWQTELSDSFPWQDDKIVWNARMERGKRSDQELSNQERGVGGKNRWQTRGTRLAEELRTAEPLLTNSVSFLPCSCATTNCTSAAHLGSGESSLLVRWRNSTNMAVCNAARPCVWRRKL